jgi:hypothetical protein
MNEQKPHVLCAHGCERCQISSPGGAWIDDEARSNLKWGNGESDRPVLSNGGHGQSDTREAEE